MKKVKEHSLLLQYDRLRIVGAEALVDPDLDGGEAQCCVKCGHMILTNEWGVGVCACRTGMQLNIAYEDCPRLAKPCRLFTEADLE